MSSTGCFRTRDSVEEEEEEGGEAAAADVVLMAISNANTLSGQTKLRRRARPEVSTYLCNNQICKQRANNTNTTAKQKARRRSVI